MTSISYCIAAFRPTYCRLLVEDLIRKTTVPYEILLWLNVEDPEFEKFLTEKRAAGFPVRICGKSPENIGMIGLRAAIETAQCEMIVQIDDDVVRVSPRIAEKAIDIMSRHPRVRQLVADPWNDDYTWGNRPPMKEYTLVDAADGLYRGGIDGWFSICHRSILPLILGIKFSKFFSLGGLVCETLRSQGLEGYLCTKLTVFHVVGANYVSYYGMLDAEIRKYQAISGPQGGADLKIARDGGHILPRGVLEEKISAIYRAIDAI